jgi:hypothetical protein
MSTSAVPSTSLYQQIEQYFQTRSSDVQQLGQALAQGNISGAQTAYNNIVALGQSGPFASGDPFLNAQREQDFNTIGQALQNGDVTAAQQAFQALTTRTNSQNPQSATTTGPATSTGPEIVLNLSSNAGAATPEQVTINITPTNGGGEQVSIGVGAQGSTSQPQVTLNLSGNTNEEVVLNLLGNTSSTTNTPANGSVNISA